MLKQSSAWPEPNDFVATRYPPPHLREQNKYGSDNPVLFSHNNTEDLSAPLYRSLSRALALFSHLFVMGKQKLWPVMRPRPVHILKQPLYSSGGYVRCATAASSSARLSTDTGARARTDGQFKELHISGLTDSLHVSKLNSQSLRFFIIIILLIQE